MAPADEGRPNSPRGRPRRSEVYEEFLRNQKRDAMVDRIIQEREAEETDRAQRRSERRQWFRSLALALFVASLFNTPAGWVKLTWAWLMGRLP